MENHSDILSKTAVVICVYNNAGTIRSVVERVIAQQPGMVVVVDDGCTDCDLKELLSGLPLVLLQHEQNCGKGKALCTALEYLVQCPEIHWMLTLDADDQHDPAEISKFLPVMTDHPDAIVIGARQFKDNVPQRSKTGRRLASFWMMVETGCKVSDCQSGFRAYPVNLIRQISCHSVRYDWETEILTRSAWAGLEILEIQVSVKYFTGKERVSHFHPLHDNLKISLIHSRLVGERLILIPHKRLVPVKHKLSIFRPKELFCFLLKENSSPEGLAASAAVGTFLAVLPLVGCHTAAILFASARLHLNKLMALAIQNLFMPPLSPFLCVELGYFLMHGKFLTECCLDTFTRELHYRLLEWLIGSLVLAPFWSVVIWFLVYIICRRLRKNV